MEEEDYIGTAECMGCTACSVIIYKDKVYTGNLGDSRAVMGVESGTKTVSVDQKNSKVELKAIPLSFDHKPYQKVESKRVIEAGGTISVDGRINGVLAVTRTLGDHFLKRDSKLPSHK